MTAVAPGTAGDLVGVDDARPRRTGRRVQIGLVLALAVLGGLILCTLIVPWLAPYRPGAQELDNVLSGPSKDHLLGTDHLGRDVLSRLLWGTRPALLGLAVAVVVAGVIGVPWGLVAGYAGGFVDTVLMRFADAILIFPTLVFAIAITGVLGTGVFTSMTALGVAYSPNLARLVRSGVISEVHKDYVRVTRMYGVSHWQRVMKHILPNTLEPLAVQITIFAGVAILAQAALDFLGLGVRIPSPSWGGDLSQAFAFILVEPTATLAPGVTIVITVLSIYRLGDWMRDRVSR